MTQQLTLGALHRDGLAARRTDPISSHDAAVRAEPRAATHAGVILACIRQTPGLQARDIARATGIDAYIVRKRTADLRNWGYARNQSADRIGRGEELRWFPA